MLVSRRKGTNVESAHVRVLKMLFPFGVAAMTKKNKKQIISKTTGNSAGSRLSKHFAKCIPLSREPRRAFGTNIKRGRGSYITNL